MRADGKLSSKGFRILQLVVFAQHRIGLIDKDLLHLGMQVRLWFFNENKMKWRDQRVFSGRCLARLADFHPLVREAHQGEDDRNKVLIAETVRFLGETMCALLVDKVCWYLVLNRRCMVQSIDWLDAGRDSQLRIGNAWISNLLKFL